MGTKAAAHEVETLEAALEFIAQYELSDDEASDCEATLPSSPSSRVAKNLTTKFQHYRTNSLEQLGLFESTDSHRAYDSSHHELEALFEPLGDTLALGTPSFPDAVELTDSLGQSSDALSSPSTPPSPDTASSSPATTSAALHTRRLDAATARLLKIARPSKPQPVSRRQELQQLRETVKGLSQKLEAMQATDKSPPPATETSGRSPTPQEADYVCSILTESESVWEQLAARQLAARRGAEAENQRLWAVVDQQVRHAKNLKRKIRRQVRDHEAGQVLTAKRLKPLTIQESEALLDDLGRNLDELYVGVDKQFSAAEMQTVPCPGRKRQARRDAVNGVFIELLDCNPVPFELRTTEKAVWASMCERGLHYRHGRSLVIKTVNKTDNSFMTSYEFNVHAFDHYHRVRCHRVARKYVEENRSVFVCQTVIEPFQQESGDPVGLKFLDAELLVVTPDAETPAASVIQSLVTITRFEMGGEPVKQFREDAYIDIAISGWNQSKSKDNQFIENVLMEELLALI